MWLFKKNETFGKNGPPKERKVKRSGGGAASDPFLDTPYVPLTTNVTPTPPKLTAEKVERGPIVRPEYPTTSLAVKDIQDFRLAKISSTLCVQAWSVKASQGLLGTDTTNIMRQVDPIYSPVDLFPAPSVEMPVGWFTPFDAKMIIRLAGDKEMEAKQKLVFSLFMAAIQLIRESRLRPRLMDSIYNFMNIGIMISLVPMRQVLRPEHQPEQSLYKEDEWEYPIAIHGMVSGAEEEGTRAREWQELFAKYQAPAFPLPHKRVYHLQSDSATLDVSQIDESTSGLNDQGTPIPQVVQQFCHMGLTEQAVMQEHPLDNSQTEAHRVYHDMVVKHRDAFHAVKAHISSAKNWVDLMRSSSIDDGPEVAVDIHMENPPPGLSTVKTRIKRLVTGVWDLLKGLTEYLAPTVVKTPATSATTAVLEPEIDPSQFGMSVPENALITLSHNRRFDWEMFSGNLKAETFKAEPKDKPVIHHKAPPVFVWPENNNWDCMERIAPRLELPVPEPWSNPEYAEIVETALDPLSKKGKGPPVSL